MIKANRRDIYIYIFSIEFHFIHSEYLISLVRIGEILGGPHVFTLFIRFYGISDNFFYLNSIFNCRSSAILYHVCNLTQNIISRFDILLYCWHYFESSFTLLLTLVYILIIPQFHGDVEQNAGSRNLKTNSFSVCHWYLNSLSAHNFSKLVQLKAYNPIYKYDFICLLETCRLDTSIPDNSIDIEGYKLIRAELLDNIKRGGVWSYHKESLF